MKEVKTMLLGGYQIIDFGGKTLSGSNQTFAGIYKKCKSRKPILLTNFGFSTAKFSAVWCVPKYNSQNTDYVLTIAMALSGNNPNLNITVKSTDVVTAAYGAAYTPAT